MQPKTQVKAMSPDASSRPRGPANRRLQAVEQSWIETRCRLETMMEEGRVPRSRWADVMAHIVRGTFNIRDPDNGDLLMEIEKGVRGAPLPDRDRHLFIDVTAPGVEVRPPSTTKWAPVMLPARSEQRNSTVLATSSAVP